MTHLAERLSERELSNGQRAALTASWLLAGEKLTTAAIAQRNGVTRQGALKLLVLLSGVLPIVQEAGRWQILDPDAVGRP